VIRVLLPGVIDTYPRLRDAGALMIPKIGVTDGSGDLPEAGDY